MLKLLLSLVLFLHLALADGIEQNRPVIDRRILGGDEISILDVPYQVNVEYQDRFKCSGAIIARTWILTGARCTFGSADYPWFTVRYGTSYRGLGGEVLNVSKIVIHGSYILPNFDNDISLLQLTDPITLSSSAQIIALPNNGDALLEGTLLKVSGWGYTEETANPSTVLRATEVPVIDLSVCKDLYMSLTVTDRMFCAGYLDVGNIACYEDLGGPVVRDSVLYGIVSWGIGCGRPRYPGVFTNVGALRDWITNVTGI